MAEGRDWTRHMREPCPDCGADAASVGEAEIGRALTDAVAGFGRTLAGADPHAVRIRPEPDTWSALEYACHSRDLIGVFEHRVRRTVKTPGQQLGWWDHEASVVDDAYNQQVPVLVAEEMAAMAHSFVDVLTRLEVEAWDLPAERRPGEHFTVRDMARFVLHELIHHRWDAERSLSGGATPP